MKFVILKTNQVVEENNLKDYNFLQCHGVFMQNFHE